MSFSEIETVLQRYYDGLYHCDPALFDSVFDERAHYHTTSPGTHLYYDMDAYRRVIEARTPPAAAGDAYGYDIEEIRFAGDDAAFAVLKCEMMGKRFTDFLSLVRGARGWRIVAKVFHYDEIEEENPACLT